MVPIYYILCHAPRLLPTLFNTSAYNIIATLDPVIGANLETHYRSARDEYENRPKRNARKRRYTQTAAEAGLGDDGQLSGKQEAEEPVQLALVGRPNVGTCKVTLGPTEPTVLRRVRRAWCLRGGCPRRG